MFFGYYLMSFHRKKRLFPKLPPKLVQQIAIIYLVAVIFSTWGFATGFFRVFPFQTIKKVKEETEELFLRGRVQAQLRKNKFDFTGFKVANNAGVFDSKKAGFVDNGYLLVTRFSVVENQAIVELVRLKDHTVLHKWVPPLLEIINRSKTFSKTSAQFQIIHPWLLKDGSLVFHPNYGPLTRIDANSNIIWILDDNFHHAIEMGPDGNFYIPTVMDAPLLPPEIEYQNDAYAVVSQDGRLLSKHSAGKILLDNGYDALFLGIGEFEEDRLHLNDAQPVWKDAGEARKGDIALSMRNISTIMLYRPSTGKVIWLKTGPWLNQHDIDILANGTYSIYGNDMYRYKDKTKKTAEMSAFGHSDIYVYDPTTEKTTKPYTEMFKKLELYTGTAGLARILPNGDAFIEEYDTHRLLRFSPSEERWSYVNGAGADKTTSGELGWCRYFTEQEMKELKWKM